MLRFLSVHRGLPGGRGSVKSHTCAFEVACLERGSSLQRECGVTKGGKVKGSEPLPTKSRCRAMPQSLFEHSKRKKPRLDCIAVDTVRAPAVKAGSTQNKAKLGMAPSTGHTTCSSTVTPSTSRGIGTSQRAVTSGTSSSRTLEACASNAGASDPAAALDSPGPQTRWGALAQRKDAPKVYESARGSVVRALKAGETQAARDAAMQELLDDELAQSSKGPAASRWRLWQKLHLNWFGPEEPTLPLTPTSVRAVMAQLKSGTYKSAGQVLSAAIEQHCRDYEFSGMLERAARSAKRSALRGLGEAHQMSELVMEEFGDLPIQDEPTVEGGPVGQTNAIVTGAFFVLREIELSLMMFRSVSLDHARKEVTLHLPVCKTDPGAL